jgi:hypothetical protein
MQQSGAVLHKSVGCTITNHYCVQPTGLRYPVTMTSYCIVWPRRRRAFPVVAKNVHAVQCSVCVCVCVCVCACHSVDPLLHVLSVTSDTDHLGHLKPSADVNTTRVRRCAFPVVAKNVHAVQCSVCVCVCVCVYVCVRATPLTLCCTFCPSLRTLITLAT